MTKQNKDLISTGGNYDMARPKYPEKFNKTVIDYVKSVVNSDPNNAVIKIDNQRTQAFAEDIADQVKELIKENKLKIEDIEKHTPALIEKKHSEKFATQIVEYVRDFVVTNNNVDNWTNKLENYIGGLKKGVNERGLLENIADLVFGKTNKYSDKVVDMMNNHSEIIKKVMLALDRTTDEIKPHVVVATEDSKIPPKNLATSTGKDVARFFVDAAQKIYGDRKYWKFVGQIGAAIIGFSAVSIFMFGRKNNVNPDVYKVKGEQNASK